MGSKLFAIKLHHGEFRRTNAYENWPAASGPAGQTQFLTCKHGPVKLGAQTGLQFVLMNKLN